MFELAHFDIEAFEPQKGIYSVLPKFPITASFDPSQSDYAKELWAIPAGRILMLLWRPCHLCSDKWWGAALKAAKRIESERPTSAKDLFGCFMPSDPYGDFTQQDCREFAEEALPFFTGKKHVPYEGVVSGNAAMIRKE